MAPSPTDAQPPGGLRQIPAGIWVLGCVSLLMDIASEMIHSLLPLFMVSVLGASALSVGLIEGLGESTALIVKIFSGTLSDYLGRRKGLAVFGYALGALSKPLFAVAPTAGIVLTARLLDRVGKGIRGAPRDALVADIAPPALRGAAFGLRQALDTVGAFLGPLLAVGLMLLWADDFRAVFWVAVVPGLLSVALLMFGLREPETRNGARRNNPIRRDNLQRLDSAYWWVVMIGAVFTLARFSEAFLVLRAQQGGIPLALVPLVMVAMNVVYALAAYPFGKLSDRMSHTKLLALGLVVLIAADVVLGVSAHWSVVIVGVALWGVHMGITQGLLATMVADTAPADLRGTAYGMFNLVSGLAMLAASVLAGLLWDSSAQPQRSTRERCSACWRWDCWRYEGSLPGRSRDLRDVRLHLEPVHQKIEHRPQRYRHLPARAVHPMNTQRLGRVLRQQAHELPAGDQRRGSKHGLQRNARALSCRCQQHHRFIRTQIAAHGHVGRGACLRVRELPQAFAEVRICQAVVNGQVFHAPRCAVRGQVRRCRHHDGFAHAQRPRNQVRVEVVGNTHRQVDALFHKVDGAVVDHQIDRRLRIAPQVGSHRRAQGLLRQGLRAGNAQEPARHIGFGAIRHGHL
ncbi:Predicted arabinose efflux permease, MFS family [Ralstonia sp. NFACC01]|nr:Predicted arabinose efflux permease, MFS family [Ralstonia sp. NFACC01]